MRVRLTAGKVANYQHEGAVAQSFLWDAETAGFGVRATKGSKAYIFQGRFNGNAFRITIGDTSSWTLGDARAKACSFIAMMDNGRGRDPRELMAEAKASDNAIKEARVVAKKQKELESKLTLRALCETYCEGLKIKGKTKSATDALSAFRVHIFEGEFAELPAKEITSRNISEIIRKVYESGKERTAGILRNYLVAAYNAARKAPFDPKALSMLIQFDITSNPAEIISTIPIKRGERHLSADELKAYLFLLGESPIDLFLKVHLYSATQRMSQLARVRMSDYQSEKGILRLLDPKGKRAVAREHLIPLTSKASATIDSMAKGTDLLFTSNWNSDTLTKYAGKRVSEISKAMGKESFDIGDLRRTCETMLAEMGISKEVRGQLLSHGIGGVQDAHYDRYSYMKEKHNALIAWESKLDEITTGKVHRNVRSITKVA